MRKKIQYRAVDVQHVSVEQALEAIGPGPRAVVGVDVAKRHFVAALCDDFGETRLRLRFEHPTQTALFVAFLEAIKNAGKIVEVAMEPTGTYGDALRYRLGARGISVFRVSNKHVHDAAELFDGSPSKHDGKDASVIGWLHAHGRSKPWQELDPARRSIRALVAQRDLYDEPVRRLTSQIEPLLARHFPEFEKLFDLSQTKTPWLLLEEFGAPAALAKSSVQSVSEFLKDKTRRTPPLEILEALLEAAKGTTGVEMVREEIELVQRTAAEVLHLMRLRNEVDARIEKAAEQVPVVQAIRPCLGAVTAAIIYAYLGDPGSYASAASFEKAIGLNLIEFSSGKDPNVRDVVPRHISKRGPGVVRRYLFIAAMRLVHKDPLAKAWYRARRSFTAEQKTKGVVAVQRKLCRALFHVAKGQPFDTSKLFDARRLQVALPGTQEVA